MNCNFSTFQLFPKAEELFKVRSIYRLMPVAVVLLWMCHGVPLCAQTVIGGNTPDPSAMLDVQGTSKGVLIPRMTVSERNAIVSPATGLMIYNTDINSIEINLGTPASPSWQVIIQAVVVGAVATLDCNNFRFVGPRLRSTVAASGNSVRVPYTGGNGGSHNGQTVTSTGVTGLTATLAAGSFATGADSLTYTITGTPSADGLAAFALNIGGQTCTLSVTVGCGAYVAAGVWKQFLCYNLGAANTSADPFTPSWEIVGNYYQWGRNPTCFGLDGTDGTNPCSSPVYGAAGPFGSSASEDNSGNISGWSTTDATNGSWVDASTTATPVAKGPGDPCPTGFRIPSETQWQGVIDNNLNTAVGSSWSDDPLNYATGKNFGPALFLPAAGYRGYSTGTLFGRGSYGLYWSSTEYVTGSAWNLDFDSGGAYMGSIYGRTNGLSVRCVAE